MKTVVKTIPNWVRQIITYEHITLSPRQFVVGELSLADEAFAESDARLTHAIDDSFASCTYLLNFGCGASFADDEIALLF